MLCSRSYLMVVALEPVARTAGIGNSSKEKGQKPKMQCSLKEC